jgi:hypothetical protein
VERSFFSDKVKRREGADFEKLFGADQRVSAHGNKNWVPPLKELPGGSSAIRMWNAPY